MRAAITIISITTTLQFFKAMIKFNSVMYTVNNSNTDNKINNVWWRYRPNVI